MDTLAHLVSLREHLLAQERHRHPLRLTKHGYKVYSQSDEDGIIAEIFRRIGTADRSFVEFGVHDGLECNTSWLLMNGWSGLWIDANEAACAAVRTTHRSWIESGALTMTNAFVTAENINPVIGAHYPRSREIDLLSVDVDYNDYWIWKAITDVRPRVVIIEYNATWLPPLSISVPYAPSAVHDGSNYFGASLNAFAKLGTEKGYDLVGCCLAGVNAFFVRRDLVQGRFLAPGSAEEHYEPPRYYLASLPAGHRSNIGPVVHV
ncbi:hypothetical protein [Methylobacterium durans]|uniref:Methyltransferase FkbM domain-containing protein n=1 Tax=Methylobacterium durans TaxID=2202825 RepID=A0A2U8WAY1_9HYPH|nr:hypothetical protein [Methylobacterium durans]AWN43297.1 hypothetical protein DK389_25830 [Methylobacterium durans]